MVKAQPYLALNFPPWVSRHPARGHPVRGVGYTTAEVHDAFGELVGGGVDLRGRQEKRWMECLLDDQGAVVIQTD